MGLEHGTIADADTVRRGGTGPTISLVVTAHDDLHELPDLLDRLRPAMRDDDEIVLLSCCDARDVAMARPWLRTLVFPGASSFTLRAQVPAISRRDWVILLEDHSPVTPATIETIRAILREAGELDMIVFLAKNLTSTGPWGWANFLFTFFQLWAPIASVPPMAAKTAAIVRRACLGDVALAEGEWELETIPRIFAGSRTAWSNDVFIDHIRHLDAWSAVFINFCNARLGASLQRRFGISFRGVVWEGWHCVAQRPGMIARALAPRGSELPPGTVARLRAIGGAHLLGNVIGYWFGPGKAAQVL